MKDIPDVLTPKEVAQLLMVDTRTVRQYIEEGKIKAIRLSRNTTRILRKDVEYLFK